MPMIRAAHGAFLLLALAIWTAGCQSVPDAGSAVRVSGGLLQGQLADGVRVFRGIPYAAAPVGPRRWRAPAPPETWRGTRQASDFGPACPQPPRPDRPRASVRTSEDCLFLNVWAPEAAESVPVMVWIHGGAFRVGSGSMAFYDGTSFARHGVILITLNYRLGRLGFFAHPALQEGGNFGLMDQAAALTWVRDNVAAFGGDPDNVTVFGESAGGASVLHLLTAPPAAGLFARAIIESGGGLQVDRHLSETRGGRPSLLAEGVAWRGAEVSAAELRALPAETVIRGEFGSVASTGPVIDGDWVPDDPGALLLAGRFNKVPVMVGSNSNEASVLGAFGGDPAKVLGAAADAPRLRELYPQKDWAAQAWGDGAFVAGARLTARAVAAAGLPAYLYHFDYVLERRRDKVPGAGHGSEIPFVFNTLDALPAARLLVGAQDRAMAGRMHSHWLSFARGGNPAGRVEGYWPAYRADNDALLYLGETVQIERGMRRQQLDFHEALWRQRREQ